MGSPAKLPAEEARREVHRLAWLADELANGLEDLMTDERYRIWNEGGAPFGKPQFPGPAGVTGNVLAAEAGRLAERLERLIESFDHRQEKERERRVAQRERRAARGGVSS